MMITKDTPAHHPIHDIIKNRWSPRAFNKESLTELELSQVMEAARWAPSAMNEQPWRYIVARREQTELFNMMLTPLAEGNSMWAKDAGALVLAISQQNYSGSGNPNRHAYHDLGLANAHLILQAEALGIRSHQMGGFDANKARELFEIPEGFEPLTYIALGRQGTHDHLADFLQEREAAPRQRKPQSEFVFQGAFGKK